MMVTPEVVKAVREHFACSTLLGAEIENQGGSGTAGSHWEERLFGNEAMVGTIGRVPKFSKITLAALQDSGWYSVDYSLAEPLHWGRGLGCDFVTKSCLGWRNVKSPASSDPFCFTFDDDSLICNDDYSGIGRCNIDQSDSALPSVYQYFNSDPGLNVSSNFNRIGGFAEEPDFCPIVPTSSFRVCSSSSPPEVNLALQSFGADSRCFTQPSPWEKRKGSSTQLQTTYGAGCYRFKCTPYGVLIFVGARFYNCSSEATNSILIFNDLPINGSTYTGNITCPSC
ncbi:leishmanolysin-related zinc metalloendopeptidase, partial [Salmonella sp. s51228]|uniref:leishmanolysin-related zinc metalloendopeptidase n=1 Tax=Salmonella sp. s51228 TaxID=3159652 RepID=UPI0039802E43